MPKELKLRNAKYDVVAYDPVTKIARVNIDLYQEAIDQNKPPSDILSGCKVINLTKHKAVPHRVYYTNDLQYEMEQVSWQPEEGNEYRIEISSGEDSTARMFPAVGAGEPLMLEEGPLDLGACHPHLTVADWDGDGRQDLLVGISGEAGYIYFLRNMADDDNPAFHAGVRLRADGKVIKAADEERKSGITQPWAGDWDDDGLLDLLVLCGAKGEDFESRITFYKNVGSTGNPLLKDMGPLLNEKGEPLVLSSGAPGFYNCFHPTDWTRNGTMDILAVIPDEQFHGEKQLVLFENVGTRAIPRFCQNPVPITTKSGNGISFRGLIDTFLPVDWIREGFTDIMLATCMHHRTIFLYENAAKSTEERPILLDSGPSPKSGSSGSPAPEEFQTDYPAPVLKLHNGEEACLLDVSPQISSIEVVRWGPSSKRELIVATNEGYLCRFRNLSASDQKPVLDRPEAIKARHPAIFVGAFAVPACADWNNDGKPDVIVGCEWGELQYFENDGTLENPMFIARGKVCADGEVIKYPGCYRQILENLNGYSSPIAVDLDRDGLIDLVVSESRGYFNFYRNIGTPEKAVFDQGRRLYLDGQVFHSPWRVMPAFFNNDGEGFTNMIAKEADGTFYFYRNREDDILTFTKTRSLTMESGQVLTDNMYGRTRIAMVDWDGDGVYDLVLGTHGHRLIVEGDRYRLETVGGGGQGAGLIRFENTGTNAEPIYKLPREMKVGNDILKRGGGHALNPSFTNWFGHEKNDMLLGTEDGRVYLYRRELLS